MKVGVLGAVKIKTPGFANIGYTVSIFLLFLHININFLLHLLSHHQSPLN